MHAHMRRHLQENTKKLRFLPKCQKMNFKFKILTQEAFSGLVSSRPPPPNTNPTKAKQELAVKFILGKIVCFKF